MGGAGSFSPDQDTVELVRHRKMATSWNNALLHDNILEIQLPP
jgi:hypothetical protein